MSTGVTVDAFASRDIRTRAPSVSPTIYCQKQLKLEVWDIARREAARRRKSEWKVNLGSRNSSRSNGSWRMTPKTIEPRGVWMDLRQLTVCEHFGWVNMRYNFFGCGPKFITSLRKVWRGYSHQPGSYRGSHDEFYFQF